MFFVFDLETIPDIDLLRAAVDGASEDDELLIEQATEQISRNKSGFMPPMFHRIVSWVGLWIENNGEPRNKVAWSGDDEKEGIQKLFEALSAFKDFGLIHHNGKGFDLPVITYRAMKYGLQITPRLNTYDIKYRFSKVNVDLMDEFSNFGTSMAPKLKHLGLLIDIPFKQTAEGNAVYEMFKKGEIEQIEHYCYEDVMATYLVWLHLKFTSSELQYDTFINLRDRAKTKLHEIQNRTF
jgi:predicted PolB exonuclease-like 3'-5' exonuclease